MKFLGITYKLRRNPDWERIRKEVNRTAAKFITATSVTDETYEKMKAKIRDRVIYKEA